MALCESQLDSSLPQMKSEDSEASGTPDKSSDVSHANMCGTVPLVDYRSPRAHFVPPEVELYSLQARRLAHHSGSSTSLSTTESNTSGVPVKRKRGRPRIDKTSPEYLAKSAARKQAKEMAAMMNSSGEIVEKRKRGRPRIDKTNPEYLARKRAKELDSETESRYQGTLQEALEKRAKRQSKRRATGVNVVVKNKIVTRAIKRRTLPPVKGKKIVKRVRKLPQKVGNARNGNTRSVGNNKKVVIRRNVKFVKRRRDSGASSSAGESTPRMKRKYTKRASGSGTGQEAPGKRGRKKKLVLGPDGQPVTPPATEKVKGKRGRPRKTDQPTSATSTPHSTPNKQFPLIRVRDNLMPVNSEPIPVDSDEEVDLGSPGHSDSLSFDENLRALRHIHEKYANIEKDDQYDAYLLADKFKRPQQETRGDHDEVVSLRSTPANTGGSGESSSDGSSSSSSSSGSSSSSSSDSEDSDDDTRPPPALDDDRSFGAWSQRSRSVSASSSDGGSPAPTPAGLPGPPGGSPAPPVRSASLSESENESPDKSFQCAVCKKWYSTIVTLKIHRRVHLNRGGAASSRSRARSKDRYECDCCDLVFSRREKLWDHKASDHRGAMTVRCEVCRKCFEDDAELTAHSSTHTADERAGKCSQCSARYPRYEQLRRHVMSAHPPAPVPLTAPHACPTCGKCFTHAHSLTRHMHNHAKQLYRCVVCKASFDRADQLAQHLNSHLANYKRLKP